MGKRRVRFIAPTYYDNVSYAQNQVVEIDDKAAQALGDSVEAADDVDVEKEAKKVMDEARDLDERREADVRHEPGDAQDVPDALRDEQANLDARKGAKALGAAPRDKMVKKPETKK